MEVILNLIGTLTHNPYVMVIAAIIIWTCGYIYGKDARFTEQPRKKK